MAFDRRAAAAVAAIAIAMPMEGLRQAAYRDPVGLPTICFGSTQGVKMGDFRTLDECKALLTKEMMDVINTVDRCQPGIPTEVLAAFSDAAYNIGATIACDTGKSTAARLLRAGKLRDACLQLERWDKARVAGVMVALPGLTKRRAMERDLCLSGI